MIEQYGWLFAIFMVLVGGYFWAKMNVARDRSIYTKGLGGMLIMAGTIALAAGIGIGHFV